MIFTILVKIRKKISKFIYIPGRSETTVKFNSVISRVAPSFDPCVLLADLPLVFKSSLHITLDRNDVAAFYHAHQQERPGSMGTTLGPEITLLVH